MLCPCLLKSRVSGSGRVVLVSVVSDEVGWFSLTSLCVLPGCASLVT